MITASVEGNYLKKLRDLTDELKAAGATTCIIRPTEVLYELSRMKGKAVLGMASRQLNDCVKREMVPYVEKAIVGKKEER